MSGMRWIIIIIVLVGIVIAGEAVYAISRFGRLSLTEGLVLTGIAVVALVGVAIALWLFVKNLNKTPKDK